MQPDDLINEIFDSGIVTDDSGEEHSLHSHIDFNEYIFIQRIVQSEKPINTIEIGCAYGISSLAICSAISENSNSLHTIIDPYQSTKWKNIGISNLQRSKITSYKLIKSPSEIELPKLLENGQSFEFGLIDGLHTFDQAMVDFYYLDKLITVGGIIVLDDISWPSINKLLRYVINNYDNYKIVDRVKFRHKLSRSIFEYIIKAPLRIVSLLFPSKLKSEVFSNKTIHNDKKLKLNSTMIALKKIEKDSRREQHFKDF